jgi:hypothetical protein
MRNRVRSTSTVQHRYPGRGRREGFGHAAGRVLPHANLRALEDGGHVVLPSAGESRPACGGVRGQGGRSTATGCSARKRWSLRHRITWARSSTRAKRASAWGSRWWSTWAAPAGRARLANSAGAGRITRATGPADRGGVHVADAAGREPRSAGQVPRPRVSVGRRTSHGDARDDNPADDEHDALTRAEG